MSSCWKWLFATYSRKVLSILQGVTNKWSLIFFFASVQTKLCNFFAINKSQVCFRFRETPAFELGLWFDHVQMLDQGLPYYSVGAEPGPSNAMRLKMLCWITEGKQVFTSYKKYYGVSVLWRRQCAFWTYLWDLSMGLASHSKCPVITFTFVLRILPWEKENRLQGKLTHSFLGKPCLATWWWWSLCRDVTRLGKGPLRN